QGVNWISYGDEAVFVPLPDGRIICARLDGSLRWVADTDAQVGTQVVADDERGRLFYFSRSNELVACDMQGGELWRSRQMGPINLDGPLVASDGSLRVIVDGRQVFSLDREGKVQWSFYPQPPQRIGGVLGGLLDNLRGSHQTSFRPPTSMNFEIAPDNSMSIADMDGGVTAIDAAGRRLWRYQSKGDVMGIAIGADGTVYCASYGDGMHAIRPDGRRKWFDGSEKELVSAPRVGVDGKVYIEAFDALVAYNP